MLGHTRDEIEIGDFWEGLKFSLSIFETRFKRIQVEGEVGEVLQAVELVYQLEVVSNKNILYNPNTLIKPRGLCKKKSRRGINKKKIKEIVKIPGRHFWTKSSRR